MAIDKLRTTYPHKITFSSGEQPNAAKLSAISSQAKSGLNIIEKAIGDIWGTGSGSQGLHQTNLGRVLGDAKYINPALYGVSERFYYVEDLNLKWSGKTTGYLTFRPSDSQGGDGDALTEIKFGDGTATDGGGNLTGVASTKYTSAISTQPQYISVGDNEFYIDLQTGYFKAGSKIANGDFIGYWVDPVEWSQGVEGFNPGIIPDPRVTNVNLTVETYDANNTYAYKFTIPNRETFVASGSNNTYDFELPTRIPIPFLFDSTDLNDEQNIGQAVFSNSTKRFWNSGATTDPFWKYYIPGKPAAGLAFDEGHIYLWDRNAQATVEGLEFYVDSTDAFQVNIKDTAGRLLVAKTAGHNFYLITHGSSLTKTIWALTNALTNHTHTGASYNDTNLDHSTFLNLYPAEDNSSIVWRVSSEEADDHIQYLHREGSRDSFRDQNKGALLGDLIISENTKTGDSYLGTLEINPSNKVYFGNNAEGTNPHIHATIERSIAITNADPKLDLIDTSGNDVRIEVENDIFYFKKTSTALSNAILSTATVFTIDDNYRCSYNTASNSANAMLVITDDGAVVTTANTSTHLALHVDGDTVVERGAFWVMDAISTGATKQPNTKIFTDSGIMAYGEVMCGMVRATSAFPGSPSGAVECENLTASGDIDGSNIVASTRMKSPVFGDPNDDSRAEFHGNTQISDAGYIKVGDLSATNMSHMHIGAGFDNSSAANFTDYGIQVLKNPASATAAAWDHLTTGSNQGSGDQYSRLCLNPHGGSVDIGNDLVVHGTLRLEQNLASGLKPTEDVVIPVGGLDVLHFDLSAYDNTVGTQKIQLISVCPDQSSDFAISWFRYDESAQEALVAVIHRGSTTYTIGPSGNKTWSLLFVQVH